MVAQISKLASYGKHSRTAAEKGQGIVEYALILLLASVALVTALGAFGTALADQFDQIVGVVVSL